jgi:glycosyltransferase involved in cell wall biosynthesis
MKILSAVHTYAPTPHSGADIYAERVNTWLADNGCEVKVIKDLQPSKIQYRNHTVESNQHRIAENYEWCDVVITNLVTNNQAALLAERFKKPIFHIVHNATMPTIEQKPGTYIIYNSHWLAAARPLNFPSIVVQPVTWAKDWKESFGHCITLVNGTPNKGPEQVHAIAQGMSWLNFIIVHGRYGNQFRKPLSNIDYVAFTDDMQSIYDRTAILLVPSKLESWSLCAAEAQACGIPVICHDLPGLRENLGESGIYTKGTRGFMDCITGVRDVPGAYEHWRKLSFENALKKNHTLQL